MGETFRPSNKLLMGPITGIRPIDSRWGGEMPDEYLRAIYDDVVNTDLPAILSTMSHDTPLEEIIGMVVIQAAVRTGQRLAVELDGCTIDTTTIFDEGSDE